MNNREKIYQLADFIRAREKAETIALACVTQGGVSYLIDKHAQGFILSVKWKVGTWLRDADTHTSLRRHFLKSFKWQRYDSFIKISEI